MLWTEAALTACALAALSALGPRAQTVLLLAGLAALAPAVLRARDAGPIAGASCSAGHADPVLQAARGSPPRLVSRFDDAAAAVEALSAADRFDAGKSSALARVLDDCLAEYVRALQAARAECAPHVAAHSELRDRAREIVAESHVASDGGAAVGAAIDTAGGRLEALFGACDAVLRVDGRSGWPGPAPAPA